MKRKLRKFRELPLGTRIRFTGTSTVWVILERHGCGLVARREGADASTLLQSICAVDDEDKMDTRGVELAEE